MFDPKNYIVLKKTKGVLDDPIYKDWSDEKIKTAIQAAADHSDSKTFGIDELNTAWAFVRDIVEKRHQGIFAYYQNDRIVVTVAQLHAYVQEALGRVDKLVQKSYHDYRNYKIEQQESYADLYKDTDKLANGTYNENANKDSAVISTKRSLLCEMTTKRIMRDFILKHSWRTAHDEGWIYIHDMGDLYWKTFNCNNIDIGNILRNKEYADGIYAFKLNGVEYTEPSGITSALNLFGDLTLTASSQQFGGFSVQNIDYVFAPYAEKTYQSRLSYYLSNELDKTLAEKLAVADTIDAIEQGVQGYEFKISTVSNALGQIPFTSIGFGLDTSRWGREITKAILAERSKPTSTFVFPKLIFASSEKINLNPDTPNYDLFQQAVNCSSKKLYPDYVSMDEGILEPAFTRHQDDLSQTLTVPMGCRSYNAGVFINPIETDPNYLKESYVGRGNVGVITLNLPKMAIEADGNIDVFNTLIATYTNLACDILNWRYDYIGSAYAESNPVFWTAGGAWTQLKPEDKIAKAIFNFSGSIGIIGLNEALNALYLKGYNGDYTLKTLPDYSDGGTRQTDQMSILKTIGVVKDDRNLYDSVRITTDGDVESVYIDREYQNPDPNKTYIEVFDGLDTSHKITEIKRGYSVYGTPAESLVYNMMMQLQKQYGDIPAVTAKEDGTKRNYLTNSWHVPVWKDISSFDKIDYESRFHLIDAASGGHIGYTEHPFGTAVSALEQLVRYAMAKGMYYGINTTSSTCFTCNWTGEAVDECPECGSHNVITIQRTCGYLTITSRNGKSVSNLGKQEEYLERVNHSNKQGQLDSDTKKDFTKAFEKNHTIDEIINKEFSLFE